ncbi:MAG: chemotaxis protein CheW [Candidatus Polarisedimenticolaceae bacterium]|nr:chemotaxis protein CheW [Candidatus Polarisedimenticolaceae bacterium]
MSDTHTTEESSSDNTKQFLTFQLANERYGVDILHIKEIIEYGSLTPVPMMPDFIAGVINLRGSVVPVINLALRFGEEATKVDKHTSIVVIEPSDDGNATEIGIMVDMVNEVLDIAQSQITPPPTFGTNIRTDFISGMGCIEEGFLVLLNVAKVLSISELSILQEISESATENDTTAETEPHE